MATSVPSPQPFRKRLFGYAPGDVDRVIAGLEAERRVLEAELTRLRTAPDVPPEVSVHLAALLQSFAETVAEGQREAEARAVQVIAEAEERAVAIEAEARAVLMEANEAVAASYADAAVRYEEASTARQNASERIGEAVERLAGALAILGEMPEGIPGSLPGQPGDEPGAPGEPTAVEAPTTFDGPDAGGGDPGASVAPPVADPATVPDAPFAVAVPGDDAPGDGDPGPAESTVATPAVDALRPPVTDWPHPWTRGSTGGGETGVPGDPASGGSSGNGATASLGAVDLHHIA